MPDPSLTKEVLLQMEKDELADCLLLAMEGQRLATENALKLASTLAAAQGELAAVKDTNLSLEAALMAAQAKL